MKKIILILLASLCFASSYSQDKAAEEQEVLKVIDALFTGMKEADSAMVHSAFVDTARMYTAFTDRNGKPVLSKGNLDEFLSAVGTPHDVDYNEEIWGAEVRIDGPLAQVWTKYAFYAGNKFSHCGVDAFHLFKSEKGWKIFVITDTRNWQNCKVPDDIQAKYKE
ncbi:nuclear transport factor 2 family protein [Fulvivirga ligni]|uniref:nuclear transport factor 2 family protein n=1 Tax=Fulvivirga ligni TaxID=2904246 RepID=UPI001F446071|nr:nuclear transport factor 2 family protein [Fulvivirga ligni]UII21052.1 nuclear transport factor 2 family protein [Fulvivirga ligni]